MYSMIERNSGHFIGNIKFMEMKDGTAELGIAITAKKQNLGYGVESRHRMHNRTEEDIFVEILK